jgi:F0F1-type ATP synthase epsilon subunit
MADEPTDTKATTEAAEPAKSEDTKTENAKGGKTAAGKLKMHVRVASPFKVFYDDDALSLSGENATGPFDILPRHHNFISLLSECELAIKTVAGTTRVRISGGVMHVKADQVVIFLNV